MLTEFADSNLDENVKETAAVIFSSPYCGTCKKVTPRLESVSGSYEKVKFGKVDVMKNQLKAGEYQVMHLPTIVFFKDGQEQGRLSGDVSEDEIKQKLEKLSG